MFQLLQPIWLYALAGLSIPVIIHLWNQRPGKTLRVGSIALVTANTVSQKKSIQLTEILLLLLRCLLLVCTVLALAGPIWKAPANKNGKGWVLMDRAAIPATYQHFKSLVDSLIASGMEFHYFEEGFSKTSLENALNNPANTAARKQLSYRAIIAQLNQQAAATRPLYVFTDNYLHHFGGNRPVVSLNLHWFTYTADTAGAKSFTDTAHLVVTVYNRGYSNDARYIKAALNAIQEFSNKNIFVKSVTAMADIPANQDWLCWLSDEAIPAGIKAANILAYATGKSVPYHSYILPEGKLSFDAIDLFAAVAEKDSTTNFPEIYWKDGFGHPLLTATKNSGAMYYRLYTHIDPAWNELPWSDNFPQMLYTLLYTGTHRNLSADTVCNTIIDSSQVTPIVLPEKQAGLKPILFAETKLGSLFWLMALLLFFAERAFSFYQRKKYYE